MLTNPATPPRVRSDALAMRRLIAKEKGDSDPWDLKLAAGGLLDIEFIAQTLVLIHAHEHPDVIANNTGEVLARAARRPDRPRRLRYAATGLCAMRDLFQWQRLSIAGSFDPDAAGPGLQAPHGLRGRPARLQGARRDLTDHAGEGERSACERWMSAG